MLKFCHEKMNSLQKKFDFLIEQLIFQSKVLVKDCKQKGLDHTLKTSACTLPGNPNLNMVTFCYRQHLLFENTAQKAGKIWCFSPDLSREHSRTFPKHF